MTRIRNDLLRGVTSASFEDQHHNAKDPWGKQRSHKAAGDAFVRPGDAHGSGRHGVNTVLPDDPLVAAVEAQAAAIAGAMAQAMVAAMGGAVAGAPAPAEAKVEAIGIPFDRATEVVPDVGPQLAKAISEGDANGDGTINQAELAAVYRSAGMPEQQARNTAEALLALVGKSTISIDDLDAVQDALVKVWVSAQADEGGEAFVSSLLSKYGEYSAKKDRRRGRSLSKDDLVTGLLADGWSKRAADSLAGLIFSQPAASEGVTESNKRALGSALDSRIKNAKVTAAALELEQGGLFVTSATKVAQAGTAGMLFDPKGEAVPDVGPQLAKLIKEGDANDDGSIGQAELAAAYQRMGVPEKEARETAEALLAATGKTTISIDDVDAMQDVAVKVWVAANAENGGEAFVSSLRSKYGDVHAKRLSKDDLITGLLADGWSQRAARSLAKVVLGEGIAGAVVNQSGRAIDAWVKDAKLTAAAHELESSLLFADAAKSKVEHAAAMARSLAANAATVAQVKVKVEPLAGDAAAVAVVQSAPALRNFLSTYDFDGGGALGMDKLVAGLIAGGMSDTEAAYAARAMFSLVAARAGASELDDALSRSQLAPLFSI